MGFFSSISSQLNNEIGSAIKTKELGDKVNINKNTIEKLKNEKLKELSENAKMKINMWQITIEAGKLKNSFILKSLVENAEKNLIEYKKVQEIFEKECEKSTLNDTNGEKIKSLQESLIEIGQELQNTVSQIKINL